MNIGILALQGDFSRHGQAVKNLGHKPLYIRDSEALQQCDKLIIPGGESTTFLNLIDKLELRPSLLEFGKNKAVMGTCAGLIILSAEAPGLPFEPLGLIDIRAERNAYGRQIDSFIDTVKLNLSEQEKNFEGVFIRAPKITLLGPDVRPLGYHKDDIVAAANQNILVTTFHPELTEDLRIHDYFLKNTG